MKNKIIASAGWSAVEALSGQVISFVVFLILARLLTPADFGIMALANIFVLIVQYLIFQGLGQAIIQFDDLDEEYLSTVFWINLAISFFLVFITWVGAPFIAAWFDSPMLATLLRALSPIFLLAALTDVQNNLLGRNLEFKSLAIRTLLSYALGGIVGIVMAWRGFGVWSFVGQQLTVWMVNFATLWTASSWRPRLLFSRMKARRLLGFGSHLLGVDLMSLASKRMDQFVVGHALGAASLGFYAVGARVSSLVNEVIVKSLSRVTLSGLSRLQNERARFASALQRIFELQMAVALPIAAGLFLLATAVVQLCFGSKWLPGVPVMQVLLLAIPFEALSAIHFSALTALGRPKWCSLLMGLHAATNITFCLLAATHGLVAVASAVVFRTVILYPVEAWAIKRVLSISLTTVWKNLAPILLATFVMIGTVLLTGNVFRSAGILQLTCQCVAGAIAYLGAIAILKPALLLELSHFRKMFERKTA